MTDIPAGSGSVASGPNMTTAWWPTADEIQRLRTGAPILIEDLGSDPRCLALSVGIPGSTTDDCDLVIEQAHIAILATASGRRS